MWVAWMPSRAGQPFEDWEDGRLLYDFEEGCAAWVIAQRARRPEGEVVSRLKVLGKDFASQPKPRKTRRVIGT